MQKITILATAIALVLASNANAKTLTIGIDLSGSNPLLAHENFAYGASQHASRQIRALRTGDTVQIMTLGARNGAANLISSKTTISRHNRADKVADQVEQYIRTLPKHADESQSSTNLVAWLEFTSGFACDQSSEILVITDGIESSSYVSGKDFVEGKKGLPAADVDLKGCSLTFYGLGAGWKPQYVKTIRNAWRIWAKQSGATFDSIIP